MARITVEDCLAKVGDHNRFALVHLAVARIKERRRGAPLLIPPRKNKETVMALREIAAGAVTFENIRALAAQQKAEPEHEAVDREFQERD